MVDNQVFHLSGFRSAQALKIQQIFNENNHFWIVNTHLHHVETDAAIRYY